MALLVVPHPSCCLVWFGWKGGKTSQEGKDTPYPQRQSGEAFFWCVSMFQWFPSKDGQFVSICFEFCFWRVTYIRGPHPS